MQEITVDYIRYLGRVFIIMVDSFSRCVFCEEAEDEAVESTIKIMETWFGHFGYSDRVRAGIGPTFCSNFTSWLRKEETDMETDPASNSLDYRLTERAMWKCKEIIKKGLEEEDDWRAKIKKMRDTTSPSLGGISPADAFYGEREVRILKMKARHEPGTQLISMEETIRPFSPPGNEATIVRGHLPHTSTAEDLTETYSQRHPEDRTHI